MADDLEPITSNPARDLYSLLLGISKDVKQIQIVQAEHTRLLRGESLNEGLLYEHQAIKDKIAYENPESISDRVKYLEQMLTIAKWVVGLAGASGILSAINFIWSLITHEQQIAPVPTVTPRPEYAGLLVLLWLTLWGEREKRD